MTQASLFLRGSLGSTENKDPENQDLRSKTPKNENEEP